MDSSSDESFSWAKASPGSNDSDDNNVNSKKSHIEMKKRIKKEPESDSDAIKRKTLNKPVITTGLHNEHDYEEDFLNMQVKQEKEYYVEKLKKRKRQSKGNESIDNYEVKPNGDIKNEKRSKRKKELHNEDSSIISNLSENEDSFLNKEVTHTDEDTTEVSKKSKRKKKSKEKKTSNECDENGEGSSQKGEEICTDTDTKEGIKTSLKKKKSKEKKMSKLNELEYTVVEDKFTAEETIVEKRKKRVTISETNAYATHEAAMNQSTNDSEETMEISNVDVVVYMDESQGHNNNDSYATPNNTLISGSITQRTPRLSDRIRFEEETDFEEDMTHKKTSLSLFNKILRQNENLQPVKKSLHKNTDITDDDEIWIVKCPHDVKIGELKNNNFNLDSKSKIKISGETYCGTMEDTVPINIVTYSNQDFKIERIAQIGTIHFKKRLPKPHYQEDNVMANNQTDFIALPETKCPHPLFGSNYKDYINVSVSYLTSSDALDASTSSDRKKKKKQKKERQPEPEVLAAVKFDPELSNIKAPKIEPDSDVPVKKPKKRKHSNNEEHSGKKCKRIKLELNSADAWESEKAIEENLFNF